VAGVYLVCLVTGGERSKWDEDDIAEASPSPGLRHTGQLVHLGSDSGVAATIEDLVNLYYVVKTSSGIGTYAGTMLVRNVALDAGTPGDAPSEDDGTDHKGEGVYSSGSDDDDSDADDSDGEGAAAASRSSGLAEQCTFERGDHVVVLDGDRRGPSRGVVVGLQSATYSYAASRGPPYLEHRDLVGLDKQPTAEPMPYGAGDFVQFLVAGELAGTRVTCASRPRTFFEPALRCASNMTTTVSPEAR